MQRAAAVVEYPDDFPASISRYLNSESRESGISVSRVDIYFDDDYKQAKLCDPIIKKYATQWLEYVEAKEGYWKFLQQVVKTAWIE